MPRPDSRSSACMLISLFRLPCPAGPDLYPVRHRLPARTCSSVILRCPGLSLASCRQSCLVFFDIYNSTSILRLLFFNFLASTSYLPTFLPSTFANFCRLFPTVANVRNSLSSITAVVQEAAVKNLSGNRAVMVCPARNDVTLAMQQVFSTGQCRKPYTIYCVIAVGL